VDLATAEPGEPGQLMNNDDANFVGGDRFAEPAILCAILVISPRNNIGEPLDACVRILFGDEFLKLADLSFVVLTVGRDAGV
jgi:hypothetical protein